MDPLNTPFGLFRVNRLPYGVSSAPAIFQRTLENLLKNIPNVVVYIDDILITGENQEVHDKAMKAVLDKILKSGLILKQEKCEWYKSSIQFLGHIISQEGITPVPAKIEAIQKMKPPTNINELRTFLGLINYYHKFVKNPAKVLEPLHQLLRKDVKWEWLIGQENAFNDIKQLLSSSKTLVHFDPQTPLVLTTDASHVGIGAILAHVTKDGERPIGYVSRSLNGAEKNYSTTEKESLAIIFGILKFQNYLHGHHFTIVTDHKPLIGLFEKGHATLKIAAGRITRWCVFLNQFNYNMEYKKGTDILHADTLSRFPVAEAPTVLIVHYHVKPSN